MERSTFPVENRLFRAAAFPVSRFNHLTIFYKSIWIPTVHNARYLYGYINYIFAGPVECIHLDELRLVIKILRKLILLHYPIQMLESLLKVAAEWMNFKVQCQLYKDAWSHYLNLPVEETRIYVFRVFGLLSQYICAPLFISINRFSLLSESADPSLDQVLLHFGPLMTFLFATEQEVQREDYLKHACEHFFIGTERILISESFLLYLDTLINTIPQSYLKLLNSMLKTFLNHLLVFPESQEIPDKIVYCCRKDLFAALAQLIYLNSDTFTLNPSQMAYLFIKAARSRNQRIHFILLTHFKLSLYEFDTEILPVLNYCCMDQNKISNIRQMVIDFE